MKTKQTVSIVGIGMGNKDTLTIEADQTIRNADYLIGAERLLHAFDDLDVPRTAAVASQEIIEHIELHPEYRHIVILMSGDVGFYSGATLLAPKLRQYDLKLYPGISSLQYFSARLGCAWNDMKIVSLHGRQDDLLSAVRANGKTFVLTGGFATVRSICRDLCDNGLPDVTVHIGENLSYKEERIATGRAKEFLETDFDSLSVMLIQNKNPQTKTICVHGLPDEAFVRGDVPMTKSEVRSVSISKLNLCEDDVLYDVGAGTGSVSVEVGRVLSRGAVYAIEKKDNAIALIEKNTERFALKNVRVVNGTAPDAFENLPIPTKAFIGGSSGNMDEIIAALLEMNPAIRIVINVIALESLTDTLNALKKHAMQNTEAVQLTVAKSNKIGNYHMMMGQNPIYIITAEGNGADYAE